MADKRLILVFLHKNLLYLLYNWASLFVIFIGSFLILFTHLKFTYRLLTPTGQTYEPKDYSTLKQNYFPSNDYDLIFYAPNTTSVYAIMENVRLELEIIEERYNAFDNVAEMRLMMEQKCQGTCFAIEFSSIPERGAVGVHEFIYDISSNKMRISPNAHYVNDEHVSGNKDDDEYIRNGFFTLQYTIDKEFLKWQGVGNNYDLEINSMPTINREHMDSNRLVHFGTMFAIIFSVLLLSTFLVPFVEEKQNGLKEFLALATPMSFLNGLMFFTVRFLLYGIFMSAVFVAADYYKILGLSYIGYMIILFLFFMISLTSYTYLISVCFNSVFYAKVGGLLLLVIPYIFYLVEGSISTVAVCLFSTKTFMEGLDIFQTYANKHRKFMAEDLFVTIKDDSLKMFNIYMILLLQSLVYMLLYNYLACVFSGPGRLKRSFLFFLNSSFYKRRNRNEYTTGTRGTDAVLIQELYKRFKTTTGEIIISDNLNMSIKNKQITVLLGHNGAGKTTTLNMIMGLESKDAGKIVVYSERDVASYRHLIGFCPQHSVFMNYMNCKQHLVFFAQLRGLTQKEAEKLAYHLLHDLRLIDKCNEYGANLSGGMKRRLSLGIALAGETKVIILDEPSSGLDIESRRELWDILLEKRKSKAILVTTHYMEEAEVLGDNIYILGNGKVQRKGTPLELKRKYSTGYRLKLLTKGDLYKEQETLQKVQAYVPNAKVLNIVPPTVYISLPYQNKSSFHEMLLELEQSSSMLGIASISITDSTLEDVFLNCAAISDQVDSPDYSRIDLMSVPYKPLEKSPQITWRQQLHAIAYKKKTFVFNEWLYTLIMLIIPFICTSFALLLMHSMSVVTNEEILPLKLDKIRGNLIYVHNPTTEHSNIEQLLFKEIAHYGIEAKKLQITVGNTMNDELQALQLENLSGFLESVIGIIDILPRTSNGGFVIRVFASGNIYHSSVTLLNLIDSIIFKTRNPNSDINTSYVPIRKFITAVSPMRLDYYAVIVSVGMFFSIFYYISLPFREHTNGFKDLQAMPHLTYWLSTYICDIIQHLIMCIFLFWIQWAVMPEEFYNTYEQFVIIVTIFFYGCSYLPILYCFANSFKSISTITTYLLFMLIISAIVPLITSSNIQAMIHHETKILFLSFLPDFNLNHQLRLINENFIINRRNVANLKDISAKANIVLKVQDELNTGGFFVNATIMATITMFLLIFLLDNKYRREVLISLLTWRKCRQVMPKYGLSVTSQNHADDAEEQCNEENALVAELLETKQNLSDYPLVVSNLTKQFHNKLAVRQLSFAVEEGKCFGLLGVNGAGKTTTFQMIASNVTITAGTIKINGIDILEQETQYRYRFGYCPQTDSLNKFMTAEQSLKYMAMLRGLKDVDIKNEVNYWLEKMNLEKYKNVLIRHYSGGTKRKLLAALAMIGSPSLVLLDEPTTGVDPVSRRFLWKCIQDFQARKKTIVLTSHSMDECEQLCNRLSIMADGKFKCIGGICALKLRYGCGFTIKVKMKDVRINIDNLDNLHNEMIAHFPESVLRENHAGMLTYFVCNTEHIQWSSVFKRTEQFLYDVNSKIGDIIEDYSVNESTLEDIFLKFDRKSKSKENNVALEEV